jgi:hypothetical protein
MHDTNIKPTVVDVLNNKFVESIKHKLGNTVVAIQKDEYSNAVCASKTSQKLVLIDRVDIHTFELEGIYFIDEECNMDALLINTVP